MFCRGLAGYFVEMSDNRQIERIAKELIVHPDLRRMARSMRKMLVRKYANPEERQVVAAKIMAEVRGTA